MKEKSILQFEKADEMVVDEKKRIQLAKCLMEFLKDETVFNDKKGMNLD